MDDKPQYWYGPRQYPFGRRRPLNWKGWLADAVWATLFLAAAPIAHARQHPLFDLGYFFGMILVYLGMSKWKGEP